jgi:hypothetical protein
LGRLADGAFVGSGSGSGLGSRAGAFRFREDGEGRVDEAATGPAAVADEPDGDSEELAACLADARVILEDMSIWLCKIAFRCCQLFTTIRAVMGG